MWLVIDFILNLLINMIIIFPVFNFVASRIYFLNNSDIWNKFFRAEIEDAEEKMGFCFG